MCELKGDIYTSMEYLKRQDLNKLLGFKNLLFLIRAMLLLEVRMAGQQMKLASAG